MTTKLLPPSIIPHPFPSTQTLNFHGPSPSMPPSHTLLISFSTAVKPPSHADSATNYPSLTGSAITATDDDQKLLSLLRQRKTEEAWIAYAKRSTHLPNSTCLSRLLSQLSYQNTPHALSRAQSLVTRLRTEEQLHCLDANSLGLLAVAAAKSGHLIYASSIIKSMLRSGYLPHVKAWSAVVSRLAGASDEGPVEALRLFRAVDQRTHQHADRDEVADSFPDTGAYNAALNACANLGDAVQFLKVFSEMSERCVSPDVLTYNIMMKLCVSAGRKDLLVFVVEMILEKPVDFCITTLVSLVAAYVGFGDLNTAEMLVRAMREGRRDLCKILRKESDDENGKNPDAVFQKLLPNSIAKKNDDPPLLPKSYAPNSRMYTTLMKGYMKVGRVSDTVRMLEAMKQQEDHLSHPDQVSYTTVVSALVKEGSMDQAQHVVAEMTRLGVPPNRVTYNILLRGYCQQLRIKDAKQLIPLMAEHAQIEPDVVTYNTLIDGCILVDDSVGALDTFNEMRAKGIPPSKVSYTTLMKAFAFSGQPKIAHQVFDEMRNDPRVKVDLAAWNMLIEGYCRLGMIIQAKTALAGMKESGLYPNVGTYGSLANGIAVARKPGEALLLWREIKERLELKSTEAPVLKPDEGLLDTLAEIFVRSAFFKRALEVVACMEELGVSPKKSKYSKIYVAMHSKMFTSKHASRARVDRRKERKRAAEAFKFWLGLPNSYYESEWRLEPEIDGGVDEYCV